MIDYEKRLQDLKEHPELFNKIYCIGCNTSILKDDTYDEELEETFNYRNEEVKIKSLAKYCKMCNSNIYDIDLNDMFLKKLYLYKGNARHPELDHKLPLDWASQFMTDEYKIEAAKIIHDCYIKPPYSYDWDINKILKYLEHKVKIGYYINICMVTDDSKELIPAGICVSCTMGEIADKTSISEIVYDENTVYVQDICVADKYKNKGIGKTLLDVAMKRYNRMVLFTYINAPAVGFYSHLGFKGIKSKKINNRQYFIKDLNL